MRSVDEIIAAARRCVGARFRPHGRDPAWGLDCVGVAGIAFGRIVPVRYPLRGGDPRRIIELITASGLRRSNDDPDAGGSLLLFAVDAAQHHLAVATGAGFVHADTQLRRVVETTMRPHGALLGAWREDA
jgi:murein DD-endopeptidase / murein LD-carboxypeptidase